MGDNCIYHEKMEQRLSGVENDVSELKMQTALDSQKFGMILENLSKLPDAIIDMRDSLISMQSEIKESGRKTESLERKLDKLDARVVAIDEDGKFSIRCFIKQNFIPIAFFITGVGFWISKLF